MQRNIGRISWRAESFRISVDPEGQILAPGESWNLESFVMLTGRDRHNLLDGTHPAAQKHLESEFRTMRQEWGVHYFKLDANYWGAMHGGEFHDPKATRIEAHRRGTEAVIRGAGSGAIILGCNAPIWPSIGLINAMRTRNDIDR